MGTGAKRRSREPKTGLAATGPSGRPTELRAGLLAVGLVAVVTTASASPPRSPAEEVTASAVTLVDSAGAPAARVEWDDGQLRIAIPAAPPEVRDIGDDLRAVGPAPHSGAELLLRPGREAPSLLLLDGHGNEIVRLGSPAARPAHE